MGKTVYLAGPMDFVGNRTAHEWRLKAGKMFEAAGWTVLDPCRRPHELDMNFKEIYRQDLIDVERCDLILADVRHMQRENTGTSCEMFYCHEILRKPVFGWSGTHGRKASERLFMSQLITAEFETVEDAVNHILTWWNH